MLWLKIPAFLHSWTQRNSNEVRSNHSLAQTVIYVAPGRRHSSHPSGARQRHQLIGRPRILHVRVVSVHEHLQHLLPESYCVIINKRKTVGTHGASEGLDMKNSKTNFNSTDILCIQLYFTSSHCDNLSNVFGVRRPGFHTRHREVLFQSLFPWSPRLGLIRFSLDTPSLSSP